MNSSLLEEFFRTLPNPESFAGKNLYVWGISNWSRCYQEGLAREKSLNICGYTVSKNYLGGGGYFCGKKIFSPQEVAADKNAFVLICALNPEALKNIHAELHSLNVQYCNIDAAIFSLHKGELRQVINYLDDERSREIYLSLLQHRARAELFVDDCASWDHSFVNPAFQRINSNDIFVDCGAYVGDTLEKFIWQHEGQLRKIIAFEPDPKNRRALEKRVIRLCEEWNFSPETITVYPYGVSNESSVSYLSRSGNSGAASSIASVPGSESEEIRTVALDDFLSEGFTFLKADIESYEYKMLLGAAKTIKKFKPRLAICIYHNATDFWSIPLMVKDMCPDYKLIIRHHSTKLVDTLLYAW
ncbi:MAG: FkbM family methyltransferase [Synergistaceae bacterium]|nr:FkbM family methyltransferase [Synergistaceae bacterium]